MSNEEAIKYVKKPVVISAWKFDGTNRGNIIAWMEKHGTQAVNPLGSLFLIATPEGHMQANVGDFIIQGVQGEFYPCKPDVFEQTYEQVAGIGFMNRAHAAEAVIAEALARLNDDSGAQSLGEWHAAIYDALTSHSPAVVVQKEAEPKLDPYPYKVTNRATGKWVTSSREKWCFGHEVSTFKPDPGYSSDITDYQKEAGE